MTDEESAPLRRDGYHAVESPMSRKESVYSITMDAELNVWERARKLRKQLVILALVLFLLMMFVLPQIFYVFGDGEENAAAGTGPVADAPQEEPTPAPTVPQDRGNWISSSDYRSIHRVCFPGNTLTRVNNKQGNHLTCFAACLGWNFRSDVTTENMCVGWTTSDKDSNTFTCELKHKLDGKNKVVARGCLSGRMKNSMLKHVKSPMDELMDEEMVHANDTTSAELDHEHVEEEILEDETAEYEGGALTETVLEDELKLNKLKASLENSVLVDLKDGLDPTGCRPLSGPIMQRRPKRVAVVCLQASGCSLFSYLLGQKDHTVSIIDYGIRQDLPEGDYFGLAESAYPEVDTIVLKVSIRGINSMGPGEWIRKLKESFNPDLMYLFMRHPVDSFHHLTRAIGPGFAGDLPPKTKMNHCASVPDGDGPSYGLLCGYPEDKLAALEDMYHNREAYGFTDLVLYEELCTNRTKVVDRLREQGMCVTGESWEHPPWSIRDTILFSIRYAQNTKAKNLAKTVGFWGAGNLENSFHTDSNAPRPDPYSECDVKPRRRNKLQRKTVLPYGGRTVGEVREFVRTLAPSVFAFYDALVQGDTAGMYPPGL